MSKISHFGNLFDLVSVCVLVKNLEKFKKNLKSFSEIFIFAEFF